MTFHIDRTGSPSTCRAIKGRCPYGREDEHFATEGEAYGYIAGSHELFSVLRASSSTDEPAYVNRRGKPVNREMMLKELHEVALAKDFLTYGKLRSQLWSADLEAGLKKRGSKSEITPFYGPMNLSDAELPANRTVRRGLNAGSRLKDRHELLVQLDNEGQYARDVLTSDESSVMSWYQGTSYFFVNSYLRDGEAGLRSYLTKEFSRNLSDERLEDEIERYKGLADKGIKSLDLLFEKASRTETNKRVLYRVHQIPDGGTLEDTLKNYDVGQKVQFDSYLSTSADSDSVLLHRGVRTKKPTVVFEILTDEGVTLHEPGDRPSHISGVEREVLLPRGRSYEVVNVTDATYESTYPGGQPLNNIIQHAPPKARLKVIQLRIVA